jgi:hypothetical protein
VLGIAVCVNTSSKLLRFHGSPMKSRHALSGPQRRFSKFIAEGEIQSILEDSDLGSDEAHEENAGRFEPASHLVTGRWSISLSIRRVH